MDQACEHEDCGSRAREILRAMREHRHRFSCMVDSSSSGLHRYSSPYHNIPKPLSGSAKHHHALTSRLLQTRLRERRMILSRLNPHTAAALMRNNKKQRATDRSWDPEEYDIQTSLSLDTEETTSLSQLDSSCHDSSVVSSLASSTRSIHQVVDCVPMTSTDSSVVSADENFMEERVDI